MSVVKFRPKEYIRAKAVEEVISLLGKHGQKMRILAGGTEIHELAGRGMIPETEVLVDIQDLGLSGIKDESDGLKIGALTTIRSVRDFDLFKSGAYTALHDACDFTPMQIINLATIGGNLSSGLPLFCLPPAVMALDGAVKAVGPEGERVIPSDEFYVDYFLTALQPNEFVTEIQIPKAEASTGSAFKALKLLSVDYPAASVAVRVTIDKKGNCKNVRIALGSMGRIPFRAKKAEKALEGKQAKDDVVRKVCDELFKEVSPSSDIRSSAEYKREVAKVLLRTVLTKAIERAQGGTS